MKIVFILVFVISASVLYSQEESSAAQLYLESEASATDGDEIETEDSDLKLFWYRKHKININTVSAEFLISEFQVDPLAAAHLISYRKFAGKLISLLELQAVPLWTPQLIHSLMPFITADEKESLLPLFKERYRKGRHLLQIRTGFTGEKSAGYKEEEPGKAAFAGTRLKTLIRYNFRAGTLLQWGIAVEKDAGEKFLASKSGFDFTTFYVSVGSVGRLRSFIAGDFNINMGQGLIQWQSQAMRKSSETILTLKQGSVLQAHRGTGEHQFHRGIAAEFDFHPVNVTAFVAGDEWDVKVESDSLNGSLFKHISSIQMTGLHRTHSEIENRNRANVYSAGVSARLDLKKLSIAANGLHHIFPYPVRKNQEPANLYALYGKSWSNFSLDYRFRYRNVFLFGELATGNGKSVAGLNGIIATLHARLDISALVRIISPAYRAVQANAFTEQTEPNNEQGLYLGFKLNAANGILISGYADVFRYPWLKALVSAPSGGAGTLLQLVWKPDKKNELVVRLQREEKMENETGGDFTAKKIQLVSRQQFRLQQKSQLGTSVDFINRLDLVKYSREGRLAETGFMFFTDWNIRPLRKPWSIAFRWGRFKSSGFDSRLYSSERDVRNYHTLTQLSGDGWRTYIILNYKISKYVHFSFKGMLTYFIDKQSIGVDLMKIDRPWRSEYRLQLLHFF